MDTITQIIISKNRFTSRELQDARLGTGTIHVILPRGAVIAMLREHGSDAEAVFVEIVLQELLQHYKATPGHLFFSWPEEKFCYECDKWLPDGEFLFGYCENCAVAELGTELAGELKRGIKNVVR